MAMTQNVEGLEALVLEKYPYDKDPKYSIAMIFNIGLVDDKLMEHIHIGGNKTCRGMNPQVVAKMIMESDSSLLFDEVFIEKLIGKDNASFGNS